MKTSWWHLAQEWSKEYKVLVYDRMGYGPKGLKGSNDNDY